MFEDKLDHKTSGQVFLSFITGLQLWNLIPLEGFLNCSNRHDLKLQLYTYYGWL